MAVKIKVQLPPRQVTVRVTTRVTTRVTRRR